eukprot:TRINITY_DN23782_c0_g1_i3.p2 TRINITY_DN23782_c0_g1~~TRINITY_DN23782_c0_g1_i3.p2  ORF type:complete len:155 (+),score=20.87 TRINITY_DN23782_c0_g1_i3:177-641(+)
MCIRDSTNAYPFIIADEYKPIINPRLGEQVGSIKLSLAVGTPPQIQRYESRDQQSKHPIFSDAHMDTERGLDTLERENTKHKEEEYNRQMLSPKSGTHTEAVSYTHLTLPTIHLVQISVVAVSLKKKKQYQNVFKMYQVKIAGVTPRPDYRVHE